MIVSSVALFTGKMPPDTWVFALAVIIAGHNAEEIVKAYRR